MSYQKDIVNKCRSRLGLSTQGISVLAGVCLIAVYKKFNLMLDHYVSLQSILIVFIVCNCLDLSICLCLMICFNVCHKQNFHKEIITSLSYVWLEQERDGFGSSGGPRGRGRGHGDWGMGSPGGLQEVTYTIPADKCGLVIGKGTETQSLSVQSRLGQCRTSELQTQVDIVRNTEMSEVPLKLYRTIIENMDCVFTQLFSSFSQML